MGIARRFLLVTALLAVLPAASAQAIIGGTAATDAGSTVKLRASGPGAGHCTGSLILPSVVLTAAHCVQDVTGIEVTTGRLAVSDASTGQVFQAVRWTATPGYVLSKGHDLAYVDLGADSSAPVATVQNFVPAPGGVVTARGWGQTVDGGGASDALQQASLQVAACASNVPDWSFCTKVSAGYPASPCRGDSGGPVLSGDGRLLGVLSAATAGCAGVTVVEPLSADLDFMVQARSPRLTGRVSTSVTGSPSPLAGTVRVLRPGGAVVAETTADAAGGFQVVVPYGTYDVEVSAPGYATRTFPGLFVDGPKSLDGALSPPVAAPPPAAPVVKAKVTSVSRRRDGRLVARVSVTPPAGASTRLTILGVLPPATKRGRTYDLGTTNVTVKRRGTISVVLKTTRAVRAKVKVGRTVRLGLFTGETPLGTFTVKVRRG